MAANRGVTASKRRGKGKPFTGKGDPRNNLAGRPKDGESWAAIIKAVGDMYPEDILLFVGENNDLGRSIKLLPKKVQMKYLVTARVYAALMFEPTSGLWNGLMDRAEGKVPDQMKLDGTLNIENLDAVLEKVYGNRNDQG